MQKGLKLINFYPNYVMKKHLFDHSKKIKLNHPNFNKGKCHLNKNNSIILSRTFVNEVSKVFNLRVTDNYSSINTEGCDTNVLCNINKVGDCNNILKVCN